MTWLISSFSFFETTYPAIREDNIPNRSDSTKPASLKSSAAIPFFSAVAKSETLKFCSKVSEFVGTLPSVSAQLQF